MKISFTQLDKFCYDLGGSPWDWSFISKVEFALSEIGVTIDKIKIEKCEAKEI